jgi:hypothetical protein
MRGRTGQRGGGGERGGELWLARRGGGSECVAKEGPCLVCLSS